MSRVGGAESPSGIAGCRLNPYVVEDAAFQDLAVADAVERNTARHAEVVGPGQPLALLDHSQHDLVGDLLYGQGAIAMMLLDVALGRAGGKAEQFFPPLFLDHPETGRILEEFLVETD